MTRQYLLLRNNSQTGPLSLQDLLQYGLTPKDLVWVEGHSAGWCYPFEVDELKAFVPAPEVLTAAPSAGIGEAIVQPPPVVVTAPPSKKIFVSMPADIKRRKIVEVTSSLEEKAEALRQRALNYRPEIAVSTTEEAEQGDIRSLNKSTEGGRTQVVRKEKRRSLNSKSLLFFSMAFCAIAIILSFIMQSEPQAISVAQNSKAVKAGNKGPAKTGNEPKLNTAPTNAPVPSEPAVISDNKKVVNAAAEPVVPVPLVVQNKETAKERAPVKKAETPPDVLVKYDLSENRQPKVKARDIPINELVQTTSQYIKSGGGIGLAISVENKSEQPIRTAAVDVFYFDKAKKEAAKQTVYFSNILPHTTVTKNSPYINAASASYCVGLVSTEKWGLFVMQ